LLTGLAKEVHLPTAQKLTVLTTKREISPTKLPYCVLAIGKATGQN